MRKITQESTEAFMQGKAFKSGNTEVFYSKSQEASYLSLHNNTIAIKYKDNIQISTCGWFTNTTKERLNGIPGVSIQAKKGIWYLNGTEWNGELTTIKTN